MPAFLLGGMLANFFWPLIRMISGAALAKQLYDFLNENLMPKVEAYVSAIVQQSQGLNGFNGLAGEVFLFLDLSGVISLLVSTLLACFTIKIFIVSLKAFGQNDGTQ